MVRASRAPGRAAEGRPGALPTQPTPAGSAAPRAGLSGGAARADGAGGLRDALAALGVRAFPRGSTAVNTSGLRQRGRQLGAGAAAAPRAPRSLFSAPASPPGAPSRRPPRQRSGSAGLCPSKAPEPRSPALRPLGTGPPQSAFPNTHYAARARTHTHSHTHTQSPRAAPTPARQLSVSVRPGRSSPSPSSRRLAKQHILGRRWRLDESATPLISAHETEGPGPGGRGPGEGRLSHQPGGQGEPTQAGVGWSPEQPCRSGGSA
nr:translation initiation factor IF-2-like [Equus asinus]